MAVDSFAPNLILLDLMLPGIDGIRYAVRSANFSITDYHAVGKQVRSV